MQNALALRRRLRAANDRLKGLGDDIDSRWRVLLPARFTLLKRKLYGTVWAFPSFATVLDELNTEVDMFEAWVECSYKVALVLQGSRQQLPQGFPPTALASIHADCRSAFPHGC